jgi:hypothetical protein
MLKVRRKMKVIIARWLAGRLEMRARQLRRSLRDYDRVQWREIHDAERRARGLRLYSSWSLREKEAIDEQAIVVFQPPSDVEKPAKRNLA